MRTNELINLISSNEDFSIRTSAEEFAKSNITWAESYEDYQVQINRLNGVVMVTFTPNVEFFSKVANSDFSEVIDNDIDDFINELIENSEIFVKEW